MTFASFHGAHHGWNPQGQSSISFATARPVIQAGPPKFAKGGSFFSSSTARADAVRSQPSVPFVKTAVSSVVCRGRTSRHQRHPPPQRPPPSPMEAIPISIFCISFVGPSGSPFQAAFLWLPTHRVRALSVFYFGPDVLFAKFRGVLFTSSAGLCPPGLTCQFVCSLSLWSAVAPPPQNSSFFLG